MGKKVSGTNGNVEQRYIETVDVFGMQSTRNWQMGKKSKLKEIRDQMFEDFELRLEWVSQVGHVASATSNRKMVAECVGKAVGVDIIDVSILDSLFIAASNLQRYCRELGHMGLRGGGHVLVLCAVVQASRLAG